MYDSWIEWQNEINEEINQEANIKELESRKQSLKCEICHLKYETGRMYSLYSQASLALSKARYNYEVTEYKLACVDGRLNVFEAFEIEKVKDKNIKTMLSQMSSVERYKLLQELEGMED
jgi:hypothetical protein